MHTIFREYVIEILIPRTKYGKKKYHVSVCCFRTFRWEIGHVVSGVAAVTYSLNKTRGARRGEESLGR